MTILNPYLSFRDNARQAMEFYQSVFGGELTISTFSEYHAGTEAEGNLVMHSQLTTPGGLVLMGSDTPSEMEYREGASISISLSGDDEPELRGYFDKLADGGTPIMPLDVAPWGDTFGMCIDRFGRQWLVSISPASGATDTST